VNDRVTRIARDIAALRGWDEDLRITYELAESSRIRAAVLADLHEQITPAELQTQTAFLEAFNWVPARFDIEDALLRNFAGDIVGLYSVTWKRILLSTAHSALPLDSVLRHELVHAFQDRLFQIGKRVRWAPNLGAGIAAIHALAEGEAVCVARELEDHHGCFSAVGNAYEDHLYEFGLERLPPVIRYSLMAPYVDGIQFVQRLLKRGGWASVDQAWQSQLKSTRGQERDNPERLPAVGVPPAVVSADNWRVSYVDELGEQGLASVLFAQVTPSEARRLAGGLTSDRAVYWQRENSCAAAWHLRFRRNDIAGGVAVVLGRSVGIADAAEGGRTTCSQSDAGRLSISRRLRDIVITSVHNCDGKHFEFATPNCGLLTEWAGRIIED